MCCSLTSKELEAKELQGKKDRCDLMEDVRRFRGLLHYTSTIYTCIRGRDKLTIRVSVTTTASAFVQGLSINDDNQEGEGGDDKSGHTGMILKV